MSAVPKPNDPQLIMESIERLKEAFQEAVDQSGWSAKPVFKSLSNTFNNAVAEGLQQTAGVPNINTLMRPLALALVELQTTTTKKIHELAEKRDPTAENTLKKLSAAVQGEILLISQGGLAKRFGRKPRKSPPPPPASPRKPDGGNFTI